MVADANFSIKLPYNLTYKSPSGGLPPYEIENVIGKKIDCFTIIFT